MSVLEIRPAQREGARLLIALTSVSGGGKTASAILLGYGLANYDPAKLGFMDAENKRGSLYADILKTANPPSDVPFLIGDLVPPFSPARYIEGINEFEKAGVEVLIVDSVSHEHEGQGGLIDIAGDLNKYWNQAKREHKKFVNALLQCDMHVIISVRAREKVALVKVKDEQSGKTKTDYQDEGLQPVTEKNLMFEMTASLMLHDQGTRQTILKCPAQLMGTLGRGTGYLTPADGKALRDWVDGAKQLDPTVERFRNRLLSNCEQGATHIESCWNKTPKDIQEALGETFHSTLASSAKAYDEARAAHADGPTDPAIAPGTPAATVTADAIAKSAAAGAAARAAAQTPQKPSAAPETPPAEPKAAAPTPKPDPKPEPPAKPAPIVSKVTPIKPAAAPAAEKPLATPAAPKKTALSEPMF